MSVAKDLKASENLRSQIAYSSLSNTPIASKIVVFRDVQVMIDRDLAELYGVETKRLKEQVNRNIERFPEQFMFQLSLDEYQNVKKSLWSQIATIENNEDLRGCHSKYLPYAFFQDLIKTAKKEIVLIDSYVDLSVLERLSVKQKNVIVKIFTHPKAELQQIDIDQFNKQYPTLAVDYTQKMHDRFMIIDNKDLYHIGASLKDLGKACFAFEKMEDSKTLIPDILAHL